MVTLPHENDRRGRQRAARRLLIVSRMSRALVLGGLSVAIAGCHLYAEEPGPDGELESFCELHRLLPVAPPNQLDILFIVDDSPSMAVYRDRLLDNARRMAQVLENLEGGLPDLRVLSVNTDPAKPIGRSLQATSEPFWKCGNEPGYDCAWTSYDGELANALPIALDLGSGGSEIEQPLEMMDRILTGPTPATKRFFRTDARLLAIFITDEDDSSSLSVADYADTLRASRTEPGLAMVGAVVPEASAARLPALIEMFPGRGVRTAIENGHWSEVLVPVSDLLTDVSGPVCLPDLPDTDPTAVGIQPECTVEVHGGPLLAPCEMATEVRPAPTTELPCYWLTPPTQGYLCPAELELHIEDAPYVGPSYSRYIEVACARPCDR